MRIVEGEIFYRIHKGEIWNIGDTRTFGKEKNSFMKYFDIHKEFPNPNNEVALLFDYLDNKTLSLNNYNPKASIRYINDLLSHYLKLTREFIFEEVRMNDYKELPSRQNCLFVIPNDEIIESRIKYWYQQLNKGVLLKLKLSGKLHIANSRFVKLTTQNLNHYRDQARKYWAGQNVNGDVMEEGLFEGKATLLEIIPPEKLGGICHTNATKK